jgi:hypothetical protein
MSGLGGAEELLCVAHYWMQRRLNQQGKMVEERLKEKT